jgi:hypothetical protein
MSQTAARSQRIPQRALLLAVVALALVACALAMASSARAGEWVQRSCSYGTEYIVPEGWEGQEVKGFKNRNQDTPFNGCREFYNGGGLDAVADGEEGDQPGAGETWIYKAPHESIIAGGMLTAKLTVNNGDAVIGVLAKNGLAILANCESPNCHSDGGFVPITATGGTELYEDAGCAGTDGGLCPSEPNLAAEAGISSAQIVLATNASPGSSEFSGTLLNETVSGKGTLSFTATDPGPGVYQAKVQIDGQQVWAATPSLNEGKCVVTGTDEGARAFNYEQPCPTSTPVSAEIDTTSFADGQHHLTVEVEDAAGNTSVVYEHTITIENHPSASTETSLLSPAPARGPANGTPASESAILTAHWQGSSSASLKSAYGRSHEITGKLTNASGTPIAGALIEASQKPASPGVAASSITGARSSSTGAFTIRVPANNSSASIELAYRSHLGDPQPVAAQTLTLQVHAGLHLTVSPHVISVGHTIVLRGSLAGPIPPGGKQVVLEARAAGSGQWIEFHTATASAHGRFQATHRFTFPGPVRYQFRVVSKREADFPFLAGISNVVRVRER